MGLFKDVEIVDMGIEKEKARRDFYGRVADSFDEQDIKDLFTRLRDWEERHIEKFSKIREGISRDETTESYEGELSDYVRVLVDDKLYKDIEPGEFSKKVTKPLDAIEYGVGFEKDAILFFDSLMPHVPETQKGVIQELIDEEKQHLVFLHKLRGKYQ